MAITQTGGTQEFGPTTSTIASLVVESISVTNTAERVDINNGDGEPVGSTIVPGRVEMTATLQLGEGSVPAIGDSVSLSQGNFFLTEVSEEEAQADYVRVNVAGFKEIT